MQAKAVMAALICAMLVFSPQAIGKSTDSKDPKKTKNQNVAKKSESKSKDNADAKKVEAKKTSASKDRSSSWHGKDWKSTKTSGPVVRTSGSSTVRVASYQPMRAGGAAATRPADQYTFYTPPSSKYDYFADRYGKAGGSPGDVLGYVPPQNTSNDSNPFIYHRK